MLAGKRAVFFSCRVGLSGVLRDKLDYSLRFTSFYRLKYDCFLSIVDSRGISSISRSIGIVCFR